MNNEQILEELKKTGTAEGLSVDVCPEINDLKKIESGADWILTEKVSGDFELVLTAFENRFWGDETMVRYAKICEKDYKILNRAMFHDYAADWIFKNRKSK